MGLGFRVTRFRAEGLGFLGFRFWGFYGFRGLAFRVGGLGYVGFRVLEVSCLGFGGWGL